MAKKVRCSLCGRAFQPLKLPVIADIEREVEAVTGLKPLSEAVCPTCVLERLANILKDLSKALKG